MQLAEFVARYRELGEGFPASFSHPFLLEEGRLTLEGGRAKSRQAFYLGPAGDQPLVVGRKDSAHITIPDRNISGRHAELIPPGSEGEPWQVVDIGSTNGTTLNGEPLEKGQRHPLRDQDTLGFGPMTTVVFMETGSFQAILAKEAKRAPKKREEHSTEAWDRKTLERAGVVDALSEAESPATGLFLFCERLDPIPLTEGMRLVLGRSDEHADVVLTHPSVSRKHAELVVRGDGVYVRDLGSANGVFLGSKRVEHEPTHVPEREVLRIGDVMIIVRGSLPNVGSDTFVLPAAAIKRKLITGDLSKLGLGTLLMGIERKQKSGCVEIDSELLSGTITFRAGKPWSAENSAGLTGAEAIKALLALSEGSFAIDPNHSVQGDRQIDVDFMKIIRSRG